MLDDRRNLIVEINRELDEAQELLEQIGLEISQNTDVAQRTSQGTRLKCYQAELKRLEDDYNKSKIRPNPTYDDSSMDDFDMGMAEDQKRRLLDNSDRLERTGNQIQDAYRMTIETEAIGTQVLSNLSQQRETIQKSRNRLRETHADLGRSGRLMNIMSMRLIRDRFVLYIIAVVFVVAVILTIYLSI